MKLSSSTVFFVLLGLFVAFCMFSHVKSRYKEGMTPEETDDGEQKVKKTEYIHVDSPNEERRKEIDPKKVKPTNKHMAEKVGNVEPMTNLNNWVGVNGSISNGFESVDGSISNAFDSVNGSFTCASAQGPVRSIFGCCEDGTAKTDVTGRNCVAAVGCNFGKCENSGVCKVDAAGSNCTNTGGKMCISASGPIRSGFGCCMDGSPMTDAMGTNCKGVVACNYGTCPNSSTCKVDSTGSNCSNYPPPLPQSCAASLYGCCPDSFTTKNADGSNCFSPPTPPSNPPMPSPMPSTMPSTMNMPTPVQPTDMAPGVNAFNTSTVLIPPPVGNATSSTSNCPAPPPCKPCGRCPEPAFDCKKVPNYERNDNEKFVPQAILSDFSTFGM